jgi:hypothetical protein
MNDPSLSMNIIFLRPDSSYVMHVAFHKTTVGSFLLLGDTLVHYLLMLLKPLQAPMAMHRECLQFLITSLETLWVRAELLSESAPELELFLPIFGAGIYNNH